MLHPDQFQINEAWIAFHLNSVPIRTELEGDFNFFALMDAASCFILSTAPVPLSDGEPSKLEAKRLLGAAQAHKGRLPKTLFVPAGMTASLLASEAERQGITVIRVPEDQLLLFIGEARESFAERFGGGGGSEA